MNDCEKEELNQKRVVKWVKEHRTELVAAGVSISILIGIIICTKDHASLSELIIKIKRLIAGDSVFDADTTKKMFASGKDFVAIKEVKGRVPHSVSEHIRNLPEGHHASAEKAIEALRKGIELMEGQTIVDAYRTGNKAA